MKCQNCGAEYSNKVWLIHVAQCKPAVHVEELEHEEVEYVQETNKEEKTQVKRSRGRR